MKLSWKESHFLVILRSIYFVTKRKFIVLRLAISPTLPFMRASTGSVAWLHLFCFECIGAVMESYLDEACRGESHSPAILPC